jgi:hypothetical protein
MNEPFATDMFVVWMMRRVGLPLWDPTENNRLERLTQNECVGVP